MNFDFEISRIDKLKNWTLKHLGKRNVPNLWNKTKYEFEMESEVPTCIREKVCSIPSFNCN